MSLSDRKIRSSGYSALRLAKGEELLAMGLMRLRRRRERERGPKRTRRGIEGAKRDRGTGAYERGTEGAKRDREEGTKFNLVPGTLFGKTRNS